MTNYYLAFDFGAESGRLIQGTLQRGKLTTTELHRFANTPIKQGRGLCWDVEKLFNEMMVGLRKAGDNELPVASISCDAWGLDYMLFDDDGSLLSPAYHYRDTRTDQKVVNSVFKRLSWETIYDESGIQYMPMNTLFQLAAEPDKRLKKAHHLLGIGDGFNFLLSGVARMDQSSASTTQLYNPRTAAWSDPLIEALGFPKTIFPKVVRCGTKLGPLRADIVKQARLEDEDIDQIEIIASCSHDTAAAVAAIPATGENWAFLSSGTWSLLGTESATPFVTDECRDLNFTNEIGFGGSIRVLKNIVGLWILQECRRDWANKEQDYDYGMLGHLAASADPFCFLINPEDPRFMTPGSMTDKVKAFCRETGQKTPRKPGEIIRCVLESLALLYRRTLRQLEYCTGRQFECLHIVGGGSQNSVLNHFTANAVQIPVVVGPIEATAAGNILVQAITMGDVKSLAEARTIVRNSFPLQTIQPREAAEWDEAAERFEAFFLPPEQAE